MNEEDSEQLGLNLQQIGFYPAKNILEAQVVLLNTCSVRRKPEDKAFSLLGELALLKRQRPDMVIGVCGCMAQIRADEIKKRAPHVDFVLGTGDVSQVGGLVEESLQTRRFATRLSLPERKGAIVSDVPGRQVGGRTKLKAFVPIQYGCDKFCTFCIVPTTRGRERSRSASEIVEEVTKLAANGTKEVTLLGQTVNSFGKNLEGGKVPFSRLLKELNQVEGLERIRYTSPYPRDFRRDLIEVIRDCSKVMEQVHLPLQSGNNEVLKAMKRLYTRESFLEIVEAIRSEVPNVGTSTDIIVGFPGETDEQFEETVDMVRTVRFDLAYMFIYSPRPGTPASDLPQLPMHVRKSRIDHLISVQGQISEEIFASKVGEVVQVLVESREAKESQNLFGNSRQLHRVVFSGDDRFIGELVDVKVTKGHRWGMTGELV